MFLFLLAADRGSVEFTHQVADAEANLSDDDFDAATAKSGLYPVAAARAGVLVITAADDTFL